MKPNPITDRIRSIRRAIRARQPIHERIELIRKMSKKARKPIQVHVENNVENGVSVRINESS